MVPDFIFMLTRADRTVEDAEERLPEVLRAGVRHIGFKDVGLPTSALRRLAETIRAAGAVAYLEVVSLDASSEAASARMALDLGVDVLMGGTRPEIVTPIIAGSAVRYYPYPGDVVGHPCVLEGSIGSIVADAQRLLAMPGVHGLDLLAYRFDGDVEALMDAVREAAAGRPVVMAGSIDRPERLKAVARSGAAAFTVGTAAFDGVFPGAKDLGSQLAFIVGTLETNRQTSATH
jgi:NAD(P)H-dependent flavin oxidoreductase YrpB (nitropropane dioxygenase family)